jgi:hypothetical protein
MIEHFDVITAFPIQPDCGPTPSFSYDLGLNHLLVVIVTGYSIRAMAVLLLPARMEW